MRASLDDLLSLGEKKQLIEVLDDSIKYVIQGKEYKKDPEEFVRAAVFVELVEKYKYSPYKIGIEINVPRRTPNDYADIVIYEDELKLQNYMVVETKSESCNAPDFLQAIEQGFGNANSTRSAFLVVDSYKKRRCFSLADHPPNERSRNIISDIPKNYGLVPTYLYERGGSTELAKVSFKDLATIFKTCHDILWSGGKLDPASAFDEMSKILFAKIQDERTTKNAEPYKLQVGLNENEVIVAERCIAVYRSAQDVDPKVFTDDIKVSDAKISAVIETIQGISLTETDLDAKGQAFENFLGAVFRGV